MYRVAIVEDIFSDAENLRNHLLHYSNEHGNELYITHFDNSVNFVDSYKSEWDIILFDIAMPLLNGMEAAERIRKIDSEVIIVFITSLSQYAIDGYKVHAFDYLLKPVYYNAIEVTMSKIMTCLSFRTEHSILLKTPDQTVRIPTRSIYYIETDLHQLIYHTESGDYSVRESMQKAIDNIGDPLFIRCNSCYLVNLHYVDFVYKDNVIVKGISLQISRRLKSSFIQALTEYLGKGCC